MKAKKEKREYFGVQETEMKQEDKYTRFQQKETTISLSSPHSHFIFYFSLVFFFGSRTTFSL